MIINAIAFVLLATSAPAATAPTIDHVSDYDRILADGHPSEWDGAVLELTARRHLPTLSVASVLRRLDALGSEARLALAEKLPLTDPRARAVLENLAEDPDPTIRERALKTLVDSTDPVVRAPLERLLVNASEDWIRKILARLVQLYADAEAERADTGASRITARQAAELSRVDVRAHTLAPQLRAYRRHPDDDVRRMVIDGLAVLVDERANRWLHEMAADPSVGERALWSLAARRDRAGCDLLLERVLLALRDIPDSRNRDRRLESLGSGCAPTHFVTLLEQARTATGGERADTETMITGGLGKSRLDDPHTLSAMFDLADDPDPFIARTAQIVIDWKRDEVDRGRAAGARSPWRYAGLAAMAVLAGWLGLVLFLWSFRMLQLARLLARLGISKTRSVALGMVALEGDARPIGEVSLRHPETDQLCLYYPGAERVRADCRFRLEDDTGVIEIDPSGSMLLSADGVIVPGERLRLVAHVRRRVSASDGTERLVVTRPGGPSSLFEKLSGFLVRAVMGGAFGGADTTRALFTDPRRCFWIWDDLHRRPFSSGHDSAVLFTTMLLAGGWIVLFAGAALKLIP